ncbi:MAG TPA: LPS export ABC transporter permease LptG, partial [Aliiroseovarius sp.]|nr:LPS export ABC transporter permease LptG [Aliiroseovarius sp.]
MAALAAARCACQRGGRMTLHYYIAWRFFKAFLIVALTLTAIYSLLDVVENIRKFGASIGFMQIMHLTALNLPGAMYQLMPLLTILATLLLFLSLSRSSEMVVTRAAGRPALLTLMAPTMVMFLLGVLGLLVMNPVVAATSKEHARLTNRLAGGEVSVVSVSKEGFWLRQGDRNGQTVIRAESSSHDGLTLQNVSFFSFSTDGVPQSRINAREAVLEEGRWALTDAKVWDFRDLTNPEKDATHNKLYWIASSLTPDRIQGSFDEPSAIPIWEMPGFITQLKQAGFSPRRHQVWFQSELASPLFLVAMVLLGAAFTMRHTRLGRTGLMALLALLFGFGIYFIRNFATILGENG